jgi:hypothetical protein
MYLSTVVSGKAITEESTVDQVRQHENFRVKPKYDKQDQQGNAAFNERNPKSQNRKPEPKPGPSGSATQTLNTSNAYVSSDSEP